MKPDQKAAMDAARMAYEETGKFWANGRSLSFDHGWMARDAWEAQHPAQHAEILKRLKGAYIIAGLGEWPEDWQVGIDRFVAAVQAQKHFAELAIRRYETILELERQLADKHPAQPVNGDLVEGMCRAFQARMRGTLQEVEPCDGNPFCRGMASAALHCLTAAKQALSDSLEAIGMTSCELTRCYAAIDGLVQPKAKTPEERVAVRRSLDVDGPGAVTVWLDGHEECCNMLPRHAERYAAGLRAELAAEGSHD